MVENTRVFRIEYFFDYKIRLRTSAALVLRVASGAVVLFFLILNPVKDKSSHDN